jgi:serine/threonine protein kinase
LSSYDQIYSPFATLLQFHDSDDKTLAVRGIQTKGSKFANDFEILGKIGEGSFGEAFKVRSISDGQVYAIKKAK